MTLDIGTKKTYKARPDLAPDRKLTATEVNRIVDKIKSQGVSIKNLSSYLQGLFELDNDDILAGIRSFLEELVYKEVNNSLAIKKAGVYVFTGGEEGNKFTIDNDIQGIVEVRSVATVNLGLEGVFAPSFNPVIYPNSAAVFFRWSKRNSFYMY